MNTNLMNLKDFSKLIGKPESTVRTWKRRGEIPAFCFRTIGCTVFVMVDKFENWINEQVS